MPGMTSTQQHSTSDADDRATATATGTRSDLVRQIVVVAVNQRWSAGVTLLALASAVVPYASLPVERWIDRTGRLRGGWRREATGDPRDRRPLDRLLRWVLAHPVLALVVAVVGVSVVFAALLAVGPPVQLGD